MLPTSLSDEPALDDFLITPSPALVDFMRRLPGDIAVLGAAGKMGVTLCGLAARAVREAGVRKRIVAVSRFSDPVVMEQLRGWDVETIRCDLLDREAVARLPEVENVVFMAGRKFGTEGAQAATWAMNTLAPAEAARHFRRSRIVAFSTGCVYPLVSAASGGCAEETAPEPVGEYAQSCLGRERLFEYFSAEHGTPVLLFRLNYSIDLRYGVLHDIAERIAAGAPVSRSAGHFNVIWQGDANERALLALGHCASPPAVLNVTGLETLELEAVALALGKRMGRPVTFDGAPAGKAYLSNAAKSVEWFGPPRVGIEAMLDWTADWVARGGRSLGKPTHFEVTDGKF
jgi:nucleoside-diphosphate-sugar epimerase